MTAASPFTGNPTERSRSAHAVPRSQASYLSSAVLPAGVITVICVVAAAIALLAHPTAHVLGAVLVGVTCGTVLLLVVAVVAARAAGRRAAAERLIAREI